MQKNFPGVELTFFAQTQRALEELHVADGALVPRNEDLRPARPMARPGRTPWCC
jgi:hypothetical protein